jgi:hypothetical protein
MGKLIRDDDGYIDASIVDLHLVQNWSNVIAYTCIVECNPVQELLDAASALAYIPQTQETNEQWVRLRNAIAIVTADL